MVKPGYKQTEVGVIPEDWECTLLLDRASLLNGLTYTPDNVKDNGLLVLRSSNIRNNQLSLEDTVYVDCTVEDEKKIKTADILVCVRNGSAALIGKCAQANQDYDATIGAFMAVLRGEHNDYINQILQQGTIQKEISKNSGAAINQITNGDFKRIRIALPTSGAEEFAIAQSLSTVDKLFSTYEKLIAKKRAIKQGAVQELLTGKKRLPGFSGEWQTILLKKALTIGHGMSQHEVECSTGKYPILATGGTIGRASRFLWNEPSVLIGRKGTINKPQYMDEPFWSIDTLFYTKINEGYCPKFLYYVFCRIDWLSYNEASGVPSLSAKTIEGIEVQVPDYVEQCAIAETLSAMDTEIEALELKLEKYRQLKQGMMQQLLTGKIRLV